MRKALLFAITSLFSLASYAQVDLKKGLMLYLPFDGSTLDASTHGNNATNHGGVLTTDQWGRANSAYYFNGSSAYMQIPNSATLQPEATITLSARVNVNGFYNGLCYNNCIIDKGTPDRVIGNYTLRYSGSINDCYAGDTNDQNYLAFFYDQGPSSSTAATTPHVSKKKWDCLIFTYDGTMGKMYVNGVLRHQFPSTSLIGTNTNDVFLGKKDDASYPYWFNGVMDEVRIYNRALNTAEIDSLCSNSQPLAINEVTTESVQLPVWQNPVINDLNLSLSPSELGGSFRLFDMAGRVLINIGVLTNPILPVDGIAAGIYIADYEKDGKLMRAKIIKQ